MLNHLFDDKNTIIYNAGETLCKQGAIANQLMQITDGYAKVYIEHKSKNVVIRILRPGDFAGLHNLFNTDYYTYSVTAISQCRVKAISFSELHEFLQKENTISSTIIRQINNNANSYFGKLISLTQKQLHGRLADAIIHLSEDVYRANEFDLNLSRKDMAEFTGMSTESAIRIMKEFHNDKIIELTGKKLRIISMKLLKKLSDLG